MEENTSGDNIAAAYDNWSETYEIAGNRTRDLAAAELRGQKLNLSNADALEIGCGTGINTRYLAEHCQSVTAIDFSDGMLAQARENVTAKNARFLQNDIRMKWSVEDSSVDLIVCTLVLEHIENLRHIFAEARRVLRANGEFLIYELHPFRQLKGGQAQFKDTVSNQIIYVPAYLHTVSEFVNTALEADFEIVRLDEKGDAKDKAENAAPRLFSMRVCKT